MTSSSTYGTSRIRLVDGTLTPDDERREDEMYAVVHAGAARILLNSAVDLVVDMTHPRTRDKPAGTLRRPEPGARGVRRLWEPAG